MFQARRNCFYLQNTNSGTVSGYHPPELPAAAWPCAGTEVRRDKAERASSRRRRRYSDFRCCRLSVSFFFGVTASDERCSERAVLRAAILLRARYAESYLVADLAAFKYLLEIVHRLRLVVVDRRDDVACLESCERRRRAFRNAAYIDALRPVEALLIRFRYILTVDAKVRLLLVGNVVLIHKVVNDRLRLRDRDSVARRLDARIGILRGVDADNLAPDVQKSAAGVAGVDCSVRLEKRHCSVGDMNLAVYGADVADRYGLTVAEGVADRDRRLAELEVVGASERCDLDLRERVCLDGGEVNRNDRKVVVCGSTFDLRVVAFAVYKLYGDRVRTVNNVVVRNDEKLRVILRDYDAGAARARLVRLVVIVAEHIVEERVRHTHRALRDRVYSDHRGHCLLDYLSDRTRHLYAVAGGVHRRGARNCLIRRCRRGGCCALRIRACVVNRAGVERAAGDHESGAYRRNGEREALAAPALLLRLEVVRRVS